ncbi:hypothetical protein ES703_72644 [subsurface metagenome]
MTIHKFYQADIDGKVTVAHHGDEKNVINELRRILKNIAETFGQTKFGDGKYPGDDTDGLEFDTNRITEKTEMGILTIDECGIVKLTAAVSDYTLYLPTAVGNEGRYYIFYKSDNNPNLITLEADGVETIDGQSTLTGLNYQYACFILRSNDVEWIIVGRALKNVTDDAQLKKAAGDIFDTIPEKALPVDDDIVLIEDSAAAYAKKKITVSSLLAAPSAITEMGKVLVFNYDDKGAVQPVEDPGPMDVYYERDENNDLMPIEFLNAPNTINFFFEIDTEGDIEPREV